MSATVTLDAESVEQVARRVADLLRGEDVGAQLIDTAATALRFGVSRDYLYAHADELGAVRLGDGLRARLRFDPELVAERLTSSGRNAQTGPSPSGNRRARKRQRQRSTDLLPVRGSDR